MKNLFIGICTLFAFNCYSQKIAFNDLPDGVKKTFELSRPDVKDAEWTKDSTTCVAKFNGDSGPVTLIYELSGMLKTTRYTMDVQYAPQKIKDYVTANFPKYKIKIFFEDITLGADTYQVEIILKKDKKTLKFQPDGTFIEIQK